MDAQNGVLSGYTAEEIAQANKVVDILRKRLLRELDIARKDGRIVAGCANESTQIRVVALRLAETVAKEKGHPEMMDTINGVFTDLLNEAGLAKKRCARF